MTQIEKARGDRGDPPTLNPADLAAAAKQGLEGVVAAQTEFFKQIQEHIQASNKRWLDRINAESKLGADFVLKLAETRTIPDAVTVCQEFSRRQIAMIAEDATHFVDDAQKVTQSGARLFTNGWPPNNSRISS